MKTLSPAFTILSSGDTNQPLELYDLYLDDTTLHLVNYNKNLSFFDIAGDSQTYIALPIQRETYERTVENPINSINVAVANIDRSMSAYLASHEFRGRRMVIRKTFADQLSSSGDIAIIFDGVMDIPTASEQVVQVTAVDRIGTLKRQCPRRWYQLLCNNKFMDEQCAFGQTSGDMYNTANYSCFSGCSKSVIVSESLTQSGDYWKDGEFKITSGANGIKRRKIVSSCPSGESVNLDIDLDSIPASGDSFTISRGCDKSWYRCSGDFSNDANFAGYPTIPEEMIIRGLLLFCSVTGLFGGLANTIV